MNFECEKAKQRFKRKCKGVCQNSLQTTLNVQKKSKNLFVKITKEFWPFK